jgi:dTMP kinase
MKKGKLIVIEGSDGSGKATQLNLLKDFLQSKNHTVEAIDFPRYYDSFYGKMVARFLRGEFGKLQEVNPYLISVIYAQDRAQAREEMENWLKKGIIVLANRYATSNQAHQCGRLPKRERDEFLKWDIELEYEINKIPREDIVIYLNIPYQISLKLMRNKERGERAYTKGKKRDIVERDEIYLKNAEDTYKWLAKKFLHWEMITCVDAKGNLKTKEAIQEEIKKILLRKGIL